MALRIDPGVGHLTERAFGAGGARWEVFQRIQEPLFSFLFDARGLRLAEWLAAGQGRVVKRGSDRTVYRVVLPGLDFYLKHHHPADARARLRDLVRPTKARLELDRILAVSRRGVPTLTPLAIGESLPGAAPRASFLLTRTLADAQPLHGFLEQTLPSLPPRRRAVLRQRIATALGRLLARMHDAGITHHDLHPGNLLLQLDGDDEPRLHLIDLHAVRLGPPLGWSASRANLVVLNRWFMLRAERSDRLRFWRAYRGGRPEITGWLGQPLPLSPPLVVRDLERRSLTSNLRFWRRLDRLCRGHNKYFRRVRAGDLSGHAVADLDPSALAPLLADPDGQFHRPDGTMLKDSPSSTVVEFDLPGRDGPRRVIFKRFAVCSRTDPLVALVRKTPALRSFVLGQGLRHRALPTPRPLAVWHRRRHGLFHEGYLLTEKVPDALDLVGYLAHLRTLPPAEGRARLRRLIDQVARLVGTLHHRHLTHRDLKAANLLVSPEPWTIRHAAKGGPPPGGPGPASETRDVQVWFIDLVGVKRHGKLRRDRRVQNLARLHASFHNHPTVTRTDKLRFLRVYLRWGLRGRFGWKRWWKQVEGATRAKVLRNLRNGRPLG